MVFVDESGDHSLESTDKNYPIFVLCFCVIRKDIYLTELVPKIKALKINIFGHDLVILHERDIRKEEKDFSKLSKEAREEFMERLTEVIRTLDFTLISIVIDKIKHREKYSKPIHPYYLAMQFGLERLHEFMRIKDQNENITQIIFEARGSDADKELELSFRRVCNGQSVGYRTGCPRPFQIVIADKKANSEGLQLADLLARPIGLSYLYPAQENKAYEIIKEKYNKEILNNGRKRFPSV